MSIVVVAAAAVVPILILPFPLLHLIISTAFLKTLLSLSLVSSRPEQFLIDFQRHLFAAVVP